MFPAAVQSLIDELLPLCRALGEGKYAVSVGGSYGKGIFDRQSDLDFYRFRFSRYYTLLGGFNRGFYAT